MSYSGGVCDKASKKWVVLFITKINLLLRLSKAILNLSLQDVGIGILKSVSDQQAMLTLTVEVNMLWCLVDEEDKTSCLCKLGGCGMLTFSLRNSCLGSTWHAP